MAIINGKKVEIHLKGGFSERKGIKHFSDIVQVNSLNERTRNKLYSVISESFDELYVDYDGSLKDEFVEYLYKELFSKTERDIPKWRNGYDYEEVFNTVYTIIIQYDYTDIFTFIEGIIKFLDIADKATYNRYSYKNEYIEVISNVFKKENVNYRIINEKITDIVDEQQISSIEETLNNPYKEVSRHYSKAIEQLYSLKDFDNSIKESISSVEAMCQILTKNSKATLGDALKLLKDKIHPAMKSAFEKLYGYTSDANGIRHANGLGEGDSTFEEAKYMLISCSAFINYLKENFEEGK
jgi:hypothetical protein